MGHCAPVAGVYHVDVVLKALFPLKPLVAYEAEKLLDTDVEPAHMVRQFSLQLEAGRAELTTLHQVVMGRCGC